MPPPGVFGTAGVAGMKVADAIKFRLEQPNVMYDGHDWWMSALKARSERMARRQP